MPICKSMLLICERSQRNSRRIGDYRCVAKFGYLLYMMFCVKCSVFTYPSTISGIVTIKNTYVHAYYATRQL